MDRPLFSFRFSLRSSCNTFSMTPHWPIEIFLVSLKARESCKAEGKKIYVYVGRFNSLNAELNPICYLLALLELTIFSTLGG